MANNHFERLSSRSAGALRLVLGACTVFALTGCNWVSLVSVNNDGELANSSAKRPAISENGRYVAFQSNVDNLVEDPDIDGVFMRDTLAETITAIGVHLVPYPELSGDYPDLSSDGRYVVFSSYATLVADDTDNRQDVYLHDTVTSTITVVSVDNTGSSLLSGWSNYPTVSDDGRYVAFVSQSRLVADDTSSTLDIYLRDTVTATTTRLSVDSAGNEADGHSALPALSDDGRYVAFSSKASNLVANDNNGAEDIFVRDIMAGTTTRISVDSAENEANDASTDPAISDDGRYVAFSSLANSLVAGDTNSSSDVFLRDTVAGTTIRVSVDSAGSEGGDASSGASISSNGRYVSFQSSASNLVASDTNNADDIFVRDIVAGTTTRVSRTVLGTESNGHSKDAVISGDGRYIAFANRASNMGGHTGWFAPDDIFIRFVPEVTIASVIPDQLPIGATTSVTITGANFLPGAVLAFGGADKSNIVIVDENTITLDVTVPAETDSGARTLAVFLPGTGIAIDHGAAGICVNCLTFF